MRTTVLATIVAVLLAALLAVALGLADGDPMAVGILGGTLLGSALGLALAAWQRAFLERRPEWAVHSVGLAMLAKLLLLGVVALVAARVPEVRARVEPISLLLSLLAAVLSVGAFGVRDAVRVLQRAPAVGPRSRADAPAPSNVHTQTSSAR